MFDNEHLTYICGHYKKGASETYDSRQYPRERSKTEILTTINPLLLFFSYLAALLDHTEKYPGTQYTRMDDLNINSFNALYTLYTGVFLVCQIVCTRRTGSRRHCGRSTDQIVGKTEN